MAGADQRYLGYQLFVRNAVGCGPDSNGTAVDVLHIPPTPSYVNAPSSVPYPGSPWSIAIAPATGASSYNLKRTLESATGAPTTTIAGVSSTITDYVVPGTYLYSAQACNASGCSGWRNASHNTNVFCSESAMVAEGGVQPDVMKCGGGPMVVQPQASGGTP